MTIVASAGVAAEQRDAVSPGETVASRFLELIEAELPGVFWGHQPEFHWRVYGVTAKDGESIDGPAGPRAALWSVK